MAGVAVAAVAAAYLQLIWGECLPLVCHLGHITEELDNTTKRHGLVSAQVVFLMPPSMFLSKLESLVETSSS